MFDGESLRGAGIWDGAAPPCLQQPRRRTTRLGTPGHISQSRFLSMHHEPTDASLPISSTRSLPLRTRVSRQWVSSVSTLPMNLVRIRRPESRWSTSARAPAPGMMLASTTGAQTCADAKLMAPAGIRGGRHLTPATRRGLRRIAGPTRAQTARCVRRSASGCARAGGSLPRLLAVRPPIPRRS